MKPSISFGRKPTSRRHVREEVSILDEVLGGGVPIGTPPPPMETPSEEVSILDELLGGVQSGTPSEEVSILDEVLLGEGVQSGTPPEEVSILDEVLRGVQSGTPSEEVSILDEVLGEVQSGTPSEEVSILDEAVREQIRKETPKTNEEILDEMLVTLLDAKLTKEEKVESIKNIFKEEVTKRISWKFVWSKMCSYGKHLAASVAIGSLLSMILAAAAAYFAGLGWGAFLQALTAGGLLSILNAGQVLMDSVIGVDGLSILLTSLNSVGGLRKIIELSETNQKIKKFLDTKVPTAYLENILNKVGIDLKNLKVKDLVYPASSLLFTIISGIVKYYQGGDMTWFIGSLGVNYSIKYGGKVYNASKKAYEKIKEKVSDKIKNLTKKEQEEVIIDEFIGEFVDQADHIRSYTASNFINPPDEDVHIGQQIIEEIKRTENPFIAEATSPQHIEKGELTKIEEEAEEYSSVVRNVEVERNMEYIEQTRANSINPIKERIGELYIKKEEIIFNIHKRKENVDNVYLEFYNIKKPSSTLIKKKKRRDLKKKIEEEKIDTNDINQLSNYFLTKEKELTADLEKNELEHKNAYIMEKFYLDKKKELEDQLEKIKKVNEDISKIIVDNQEIKYIEELISEEKLNISKLEEKYKIDKSEVLINDLAKKEKSERSIYYDKLLESVRSKTVPPVSRRTGGSSSSNFSSFVKESKNYFGYAVVAAAVVSVAVSGGDKTSFLENTKDIMGDNGAFLFDGLKQLASFKLIQIFITKGILSMVGIDMLIERFASFLAPGTIKELRSLNEALKIEKDETTIKSIYNRMFGLLTGGYYSAQTLKSYNKKQLEEIFKEHYPKNRPGSLTKEELIKNIVIAQSKRMMIIREMFVKFLSIATKEATAQTTLNLFGNFKNIMDAYEKQETLRKLEEAAKIKKFIEDIKTARPGTDINEKEAEELIAYLKLKTLRDMLSRETQLPTSGTKIDIPGISGPEVAPVVPPSLYPRPELPEITPLPTLDPGAHLYPTLGPQPRLPGTMFQPQPETTPRFDIGDLRPTLGPEPRLPGTMFQPQPETTPRFDIGELQPTLGPEPRLPGTMFQPQPETTPRFDIRELLPTAGPEVNPVFTPEGELQPEVVDNILKILEGIKFDTGLKRVLRFVLDSSTSSLLGPYGWAKLYSDTALGVAVDIDKLKTLLKIIEDLEKGVMPSIPENSIPGLEELINLRPSTLVEKTLEKIYGEGVGTIDPAKVLFGIIKNKFKYGWEMSRALEEMEQKLFFGTDIEGFADLERTTGSGILPTLFENLFDNPPETE